MAIKRNRRRDGLTHLNAANQPTMVDVGDKAVTRREARAEAMLHQPMGLSVDAQALHVFDADSGLSLRP